MFKGSSKDQCKHDLLFIDANYLVSCIRMTPPPPSPPRWGRATATQKPAATAASTALPPQHRYIDNNIK